MFIRPEAQYAYLSASEGGGLSGADGDARYSFFDTRTTILSRCNVPADVPLISLIC
jgi:hypothetical protein